MRTKFVLTVAAGLLAGTVFAAAQQTGAPSNEGNSDASQNSAQPDRPDAPASKRGTSGQGQGGGAGMPSQEPLQPGGISPSAPPQGREGSPDSANPRPR